MSATKAFGRLPPGAQEQPEKFEVHFPQSEVDNLHAAIKASRVGPVTFEGLQEDRKYGVGAHWLQEAKDAWLKFDWRKVEDSINAFPNFKLPITHNDDIYSIHFAALFSKSPTAIPIMMIHGWPGSFLEFLPILRLLTSRYTPETLPYHIIVPSLPGYTLSSPPSQDKDFILEDCAAIFDTLMCQLGFSSGYVVQGGDVGSKVARVLGGTQPRAKAIHLNFCIMPKPEDIDDVAPNVYNDLEKAGIARGKWFKSIGSAYALEHATRPATIGLVLSSSPLALLAWVGEKFLEWTDDDPSLHTILEDVTLYWLTNCVSTGFWPYRQLYTPGNMGAHENPNWYIDKPMGFSWFPKEISPVPKAWAEKTGRLVWYRQHEKGGHFAALERPEVLLADLEDFVAQVWEGVRD